MHDAAVRKGKTAMTALLVFLISAGAGMAALFISGIPETGGLVSVSAVGALIAQALWPHTHPK